MQAQIGSQDLLFHGLRSSLINVHMEAMLVARV